jgi:hypothetical protein
MERALSTRGAPWESSGGFATRELASGHGGPELAESGAHGKAYRKSRPTYAALPACTRLHLDEGDRTAGLALTIQIVAQRAFAQRGGRRLCLDETERAKGGGDR